MQEENAKKGRAAQRTEEKNASLSSGTPSKEKQGHESAQKQKYEKHDAQVQKNELWHAS